jgi:hypothetical protein
MVVFAQLIEMQGGCVVEVTAIGGVVDQFDWHEGLSSCNIGISVIQTQT